MSRLATAVAKMWLKSELGGLLKNASIGAGHICLEYGNRYPWFLIPSTMHTLFLSILNFVPSQKCSWLFCFGHMGPKPWQSASIKKIPMAKPHPNGPKSSWKTSHRDLLRDPRNQQPWSLHGLWTVRFTDRDLDGLEVPSFFSGAGGRWMV